MRFKYIWDDSASLSVTVFSPPPSSVSPQPVAHALSFPNSCSKLGRQTGMMLGVNLTGRSNFNRAKSFSKCFKLSLELYLGWTLILAIFLSTWS